MVFQSYEVPPDKAREVMKGKRGEDV